MRVLRHLCNGCGTCNVYCPVSAINIFNDNATVNEAECIECKVCKTDICSQNAFVESPDSNIWPRSVRSDFSAISSRISNLFKDLKVRGMKNANAVEYYKRGYVGIRVEVGRPVLGASFKQVQQITSPLAREKVLFGEEYSTTFLMDGEGMFPEEILEERAGCIWFGFSVPVIDINRYLRILKDTSKKCGAVVSIGLISRLESDGSIPLEGIIDPEFSLALNVKANLDLPVTL